MVARNSTCSPVPLDDVVVIPVSVAHSMRDALEAAYSKAKLLRWIACQGIMAAGDDADAAEAVALAARGFAVDTMELIDRSLQAVGGSALDVVHNPPFGGVMGERIGSTEGNHA